MEMVISCVFFVFKSLAEHDIIKYLLLPCLLYWRILPLSHFFTDLAVLSPFFPIIPNYVGPQAQLVKGLIIILSPSCPCTNLRTYPGFHCKCIFAFSYYLSYNVHCLYYQVNLLTQLKWLKIQTKLTIQKLVQKSSKSIIMQQ